MLGLAIAAALGRLSRAAAATTSLAVAAARCVVWVAVTGRSSGNDSCEDVFQLSLACALPLMADELMTANALLMADGLVTMDELLGVDEPSKDDDGAR